MVEEAFWIDKIKSHCFVTVRRRADWFVAGGRAL